MVCVRVVFLIIACSSSCWGFDLPCHEDEECSPTQYCVNLRCIDCFDCGLLHRNAITECAKSLDDCGSCVQGYSEVPLTLSSKAYKKPCKKQVVPGFEKAANCSVKDDCGSSQYCYQQRICIPCLDCSTYLRRPSSVKCAKDVQDCGVCLRGYVDVPVTDGSRPKPCQGQASPLLSQSQKTEVNLNVGALSLVAGVFVVGFAIVCAVLYYRSCKPVTEYNVAASPPPYVDCANVEVGEAECSEQVCGFYKERTEADCMARVFQLPDYMTRGCPTTRASTSDAPDDVQDEDTVPCPWRPDPVRPDEAAYDGALSFTGRLICHPAVEEEATQEPVAKRRK